MQLGIKFGESGFGNVRKGNGMTETKDYIQQAVNEAYAMSMERERRKIMHKIEMRNKAHKELVKKRKQERKNRKKGRG